MGVNGANFGGSECDDKNFEMVPPEGGWGYLVCVGLSVIFVSTFFCYLYKNVAMLIFLKNILLI